MSIVWFINDVDGSVLSAIDVRGSEVEMYQSSPRHVHEAPPQCSPGYSPAWSSESMSWSCLADHRGTQWHMPGTQSRIIITQLGVAPPAGWISGPPPSPFEGETLVA